MKNKPLIVSLLVLSGVAVGIATIQYLSFNDTKQVLNNTTSQNILLKNQVHNLSSKLRVFEGVEKSDLLVICLEKSNSDYSKYISENSMAVKEGNDTTFYPKSPGIIRAAEEKQAVSDKACNDKFGD